MNNGELRKVKDNDNDWMYCLSMEKHRGAHLEKIFSDFIDVLNVECKIVKPMRKLTMRKL